MRLPDRRAPTRTREDTPPHISPYLPISPPYLALERRHTLRPTSSAALHCLHTTRSPRLPAALRALGTRRACSRPEGRRVLVRPRLLQGRLCLLLRWDGRVG